jgi:hypothetical protein
MQTQLREAATDWSIPFADAASGSMQTRYTSFSKLMAAKK